MPSAHIENLTESLQRYSGVQQLQTFEPSDVAADSIARLSNTRGDVTRLVRLWDDRESSWRELVEGYAPQHHPAALSALRSVLEASLVIQWRNDGTPKTFLPFATELITSERVSTVFRDLGRGVVEGLWGRPGFEDIRGKIAARAASWRGRHPLAILLAPLCSKLATDAPTGDANLRAAIASDPMLAQWVDTFVKQDWEAWLILADRMSADEQFESMASLIGLHLHVAAMWRLGAEMDDAARIRPCFFVEVEGHGQDPSCTRAANGSYGFWRERASAALRIVATVAVRDFCTAHENFRASVTASNWDAPRMWCGVPIESRGKRIKATDNFHQEVERRLTEGATLRAAPEPGDVERIVIESLAEAFSGPSSAVVRLKDFYRKTGMAAGLVGPAGRTRKRYLLDERGIDLLARLHAVRRDADIQTSEEDQKAVGAFVDDLAHRYGIVITTERSFVKDIVQTPALRLLRVHFPSEKAMRRNAELLDRRLDALRLVRRYSDASSVIQVTL